MKNRNIIVFGYGKFGQALSKVLQEHMLNFKIAINSNGIENKELIEAKRYEKNYFEFNLEDDESLKRLDFQDDTILIVAMDNNHENLFLVLTLRELFPKNYILAISDSSHLTNKLLKVGVNKVIDIYSISGAILLNILKKPIATKFLQGFINKEHDYIFKEVKISKKSPLIGRYISEIDFRKYDIIFIGMIDEELGNQFIFSTIGIDHKIDEKDILVFMGKEQNINRFKLDYGEKE